MGGSIISLSCGIQSSCLFLLSTLCLRLCSTPLFIETQQLYSHANLIISLRTLTLNSVIISGTRGQVFNGQIVEHNSVMFFDFCFHRKLVLPVPENSWGPASWHLPYGVRIWLSPATKSVTIYFLIFPLSVLFYYILFSNFLCVGVCLTMHSNILRRRLLNGAELLHFNGRFSLKVMVIKLVFVCLDRNQNKLKIWF